MSSRSKLVVRRRSIRPVSPPAVQVNIRCYDPEDQPPPQSLKYRIKRIKLKPKSKPKLEAEAEARLPLSKAARPASLRVRFENHYHPRRRTGHAPPPSPPLLPRPVRSKVRFDQGPPQYIDAPRSPDLAPLLLPGPSHHQPTHFEPTPSSHPKPVPVPTTSSRQPKVAPSSRNLPVQAPSPRASSTRLLSSWAERRMGTYDSTVLTLVKTDTPDPYIVAAHSQFFLIFTAGDHIEIWSSPSLANFRDNHRSTTIWRPPPNTDHSDGLWAPELHCIQGRWWVFYAAAHPRHGNKSHRMWVLAGPPASQDPTTGQWEFAGPIQGMPSEQWAIDGTAFELQGQLYFVYSGWPLGVGNNDLMQNLFIIRLSTPTQASSRPVEISRPDRPWEFSHDGNGAHGINEGPQFLTSPNGTWAGIVYSCAGSWTKDYKMAVLQYRGGDPLHPGSWAKDTKPMIETAPGRRGPWGPGHGSFLHLGNETIAVYHATDKPTDGWANRKARVQRVQWTMHGPQMGGHCGPLTSDFEGELFPRRTELEIIDTQA